MRRSRLIAIGAGWILADGCEVDVRDGFGPRAPVPDVEGTVARAASPAVNVEVELRSVTVDTLVFETDSNVQGYFGFAGVPSGLWELRVESDLPGDFASVSREFYRADTDGRLRIREFDVFAYGARLDAPAIGASAPAPTPFDPMDFHWTPPAVAGAFARVQLVDQAGQDVWTSAVVATDSVTWNGYGTEGTYFGLPIGPGSYQWRVKFDFPDTSEARTERRALRLE